MKKKISFITLLCVLVLAGMLYAGGNIFTITQPTASTTQLIVASGTSTFEVIDLNYVKGYGAINGSCTFQINTWTKPAGSGSGVTTDWYYRQSSINSTVAWDAAQQIPIITGLAHSGTTGYPIPLDLDLSQYLRIECTSGLSNATVSYNLTFQKTD